jgi:dolichyl-phosphate beta-glucosyltransferase
MADAWQLPSYVTFDRPAAATAPAVSVVIPAFNEENRIEPYLREIAAFAAAHNETFEILVVNDGSRDATAAKIRGLMKELPSLGLLTYGENRGKGHAVRVGMLAAAAPLRVFADADGATPISELDKLRAKIEREHFDVAIASRAHAADTAVTMRFHRRFIAEGFRIARQCFLPLDIKDTQCGFKLFTARSAAELFQRSQLNGLAFDVELLYLAARLNFRVAEVPVNWIERPGSRINMCTDPFRMFRDVLRVRRLHRNL